MSNDIVQFIEKSGLDKVKADYVMEQFDGFQAIAAEWEAKAKEIVVTDASQTEMMAKAREGRLFIKRKRIDLEKTRKELKERSLKEGQAIDGVAKVLRGLLSPIEDHLDKQERFIEIREAERKKKLFNERIAILEPLGVNTTLYNLGEMPEDVFNRLVKSTKEDIQLKKDEEKRLKEERKAQEKALAVERERIRKENEKLKAEALKKEKELAEERSRREKEFMARREAELKAKKVRREKDLALQREKTAKEAKAKAVAEKKQALATNEMVIVARMAITHIHQSTTESCQSCLSIRNIAEEAIAKIGGFLEPEEINV